MSMSKHQIKSFGIIGYTVRNENSLVFGHFEGDGWFVFSP